MAPHPAGRIGPNAIIQTVTALREQRGDADALLAAWGHGDLVTALPSEMVEEGDVTRLCAHVMQGLGTDDGLAVLERSGALTAGYLLRHRIPAVARMLLPWLPARVALRVLFRAIRGHAWTFAGTGAFEADASLPAFVITGCPVCREMTDVGRAACGYYRATFEVLLRRLVDPGVVVKETECQSMGARCCRFRVSFGERGTH